MRRMLISHLDVSHYRRAKSLIETMDVDYDAEVFCTALEERLGCILQLLEGLKPERIMDIGCRRGIISSVIQQEFNAAVYGIDIDELELLVAQQRNIVTKAHNVDQEELPFEEGVFDAVILAEVIEHLARPNYCLSEIHRVLKPAGTLIITTPNLTSLPKRMKFCLGEDPTNISDKDFGNIHKREYNFKDLELLLKWHSFDVTQLIYTSLRRVGSVSGFVHKAILCKLFPALSQLIVVKAQSSG